MKKRSYFSKLPQSKLLIIFSSTRLHYRVKEKGQTMDPSITTFKLKDMAIMQTHIIPLLRKNDSGNNILKTSTVSYQQLKIVSINLLSRHSSKWHFLLNIIHDKNHEDELAYLFNVHKDDTDLRQVRMEAFSMSAMFQGSNFTNFSDILEHLESLHPTKCALIPNLLIIVHLILINPATSCTPQLLEESKPGFVQQ